MKRFPLAADFGTLAVLLFALWTVLCNLAVWWRLSLDTVLAVFSFVILALLILEFRRRRGAKVSWLGRLLEELSPEPPESTPPRSGRESGLRQDRISSAGEDAGALSKLSERGSILRIALAGIGAIAVVMVFAQTQQPGPFAAAGLVLLAAALGSTYLRRGSSTRAGSSGGTPTRAVVRRRDDLLLLLAGLALVVVTLAANHPDKDDCFYGNVAARTAGASHQAFLQHDEIFGIEGMPVILPGYKVHAFEPLAAAVSRLTGLPPLLCLHWVLASLAALLAPFAWALFLRKLAPEHWLLATVIALALLLSLGDGHTSYGNYAFIRLHQGKGVLLTVAIPLVAAFAMHYAESPTWPRALLLWASQTAAVGLSFSALAIVPAFAWIVLLAAWRGRWNRRLLGGLLCSAHPLLLSAILAGPMRQNAVALSAFKNADDLGQSTFAVLDHSIKMMLGQGRMRLVAFFFLFFAWSIPKRRHARRTLILLPLAFLLIFNPITTGWLATGPMSREVWFRLFWILPLPAMIAIGLSAPAAILSRWKQLGVAASLGLTALLILMVHAASPFSSSNGTTWHWPPTVKAPPLDYEAARCLVDKVNEDARVVAPEDVATWVPTFKKRVYPIFTRFHDERFLQLNLTADEVHKRRTLTGFVSEPGSHLEYPDVICFNSKTLELSGWCMRDFGPETDTAVSKAKTCGFQRVGVNQRYRVYTRPGIFPAGE